METEPKKAERGNPCNGSAPIIDSGLTSEKGCDNFRCISLENGKCLHDAPCVPCDREGNTFTVLPVIDAEVGNAALRLVEDLSRGKVLHQIVNADTMDEALRLVRVLKGHKRPVVTEEPSPTPHPFLDVAFLKLKAVR
jgi:hypothetical protein